MVKLVDEHEPDLILLYADDNAHICLQMGSSLNNALASALVGRRPRSVLEY
jgi:hypothetical protein